MKKFLFLLASLAALAVSAHAQTTIISNDNRGAMIGTNPTQKVGFFGVHPVVQPASATDLLSILKSLGLVSTASAATPLNLNGGTLTAGNVVLSGTLTLSGTGSPPGNTSTPAAYVVIKSGATTYRVPVFQ